MSRKIAVITFLILASGKCAGGEPTVNPIAEQIVQAAADAHSYFFDEERRLGAVAIFQKLVEIKGPSGKEQEIRDEVRRLLLEVGAIPVPPKTENPDAPNNLVMEIPATGALASEPAIILNAHLDTIAESTPDLLAFDGVSGDFYHHHEALPGRISSFGGDDRSGVAVIVEAIRYLHAEHWSRGTEHRRIVLIFTAEEEIGMLGAKHLARFEPDIFEGAEITLSIDGPLDLRSRYPEDSFVAVVSRSDAGKQPYQRVLELMREFCQRTNTGFTMTEIGLGRGDFAYFPASSKAGLHLRSPVRGWHNKERVTVQDLLNHIDLLSYLLLVWDQGKAVDSNVAKEATEAAGAGAH